MDRAGCELKVQSKSALPSESRSPVSKRWAGSVVIVSHDSVAG